MEKNEIVTWERIPLLLYEPEYTSVEYAQQLFDEGRIEGIRILADRVSYDPVFLEDFGFIKVLHILGVCNMEYRLDSLQKVPGLEFLIFRIYAKTLLDLSVLPPIKKLTLNWRKKKVIGLDKCTNLRDICVCDYKESDLEQFRTLKKLKRITLKTGSIKNLDGLEGCHSLETLSLAGCRYLTDISKLAEIPSLKSVHLDSCSQVHDFSVLAKLPNLERLWIEDTRNIESIAFIRDMPQLKEFCIIGESSIIDGDLTLAINIPLTQISAQKHYNMRILPEKWSEVGGTPYGWWVVPIDLGAD